MSNTMPTFGVCQGLKVLAATNMIAGSFAASLFSDHGAEVLHLENAVAPDLVRIFGKTYNQDHRNQRNLALNFMTNDEGREIFFKMLKDADILLESSRAGTWARHGLTDEVLWEINPKLVIVHVSGFGQTGDPEYVGKTSYDMVGQAFSGYAAINGYPDPAPPALVKGYVCDYFTGYSAAFSAMAAYSHAQKTGEGESIDVAMNEALLRVQSGLPLEGFTYGKQPARTGNNETTAASESLYRANDGEWLTVTAGNVADLCIMIGLKDHPMFEDLPRMVTWAEPRGAVFNQALKDFVASHSSDEVIEMLTSINVGSERVMTYKRIAEHPHYIAREMIQEWYDPCSEEMVKGVGIVPKMKRNPGQVWCGAPTWGMDNEAILAEMGYSEEEIAAMYGKGILNKKQ